MKALINQVNKLFENRIRLGIMSILMVNEKADFNRLKEALGVTDGNLSSHLTILEENGYLKAEKKFVGRKPNTSYSATGTGRNAFKLHLETLEALIRLTK